MSKLLNEQRSFLQLICNTSKQQRRALLNTVTKKQLKALSEIAHNVVKGTIVLTPEEKRILRRNKKIINTLAAKKGTKKSKHEALRKGAQAVFHLLNIVGSQPWIR